MSAGNFKAAIGAIEAKFKVAATGDLRVGDRVRIENNVLYRS